MGKVEAMSQTSAGGHVFPEMTVMAKGTGSTTEAGIGALIPWAEKLWLVGYVAHIKGEGLGLYEIDSKMNFRRRPESVTGTFANRMVHWPSKQVFIGPHAIDEQGKVRTITSLTGHRLTATAPHLTDPDNKVYFLTMEGLLFECDVKTLETAQLADLNKELNLPGGAQPHYKGAWSGGGRALVLLTEEQALVARSFRNLQRVTVLPSTEAGIADIIGAARLLVSEDALTELAARAKGERLESEEDA